MPRVNGEPILAKASSAHRDRRPRSLGHDTELSIEEARDGLWTLTSLAVYDMLVESRGWPVERYERWLADRLIDLLLR